MRILVFVAPAVTGIIAYGLCILARLRHAKGVERALQSASAEGRLISGEDEVTQ